MGRDHSFEDGLRSLEAINLLFDNTTFDMIFGRPNQRLLSWENELKLALPFAKNHMSIYQLMIEPGTPLYKLQKKGLLPLPNQETKEDMYYTTIEIMAKHGFDHYEVSSFGRNEVVGSHNFSYWRGVDYIGKNMLDVSELQELGLVPMDGLFFPQQAIVNVVLTV
ncbi:hypothetical protein DSO57_1014202 [Entomophthora muscae]|uniref:Uncharacterized protein n=1 Tax=Entomophthora muscae TaxID=34485 RepID=A0ACC2T5X2_9FUNG|nr:hypothetical protein DSO57_1014202 [Entomophthora muscae]